MPRTQTSGKNTIEQEDQAQDYSKMTNAELKKLLDTRKIEGRSKLTKKEAMIKVLTLFDENPEDNVSITALVAELSTPRKKNNSKSEEEGKKSSEEGEEKEKPKRKPRSSKKEPKILEDKEKGVENTSDDESKEEKSSEESAEDSSASKKSKKSSKSRSSTSDEDKPKKKPSLSKKEREELLKKEGIDRSEYPKGTRFLFRGKKIQVIYPKGHTPSESEEDKGLSEKEKEVSAEDEKIVSEDVKDSLTDKLKKMKKASSVNIKKGKKEVVEEPKSEVPEEDPSMKEVLDLKKALLKKLTSLENEAYENDEFKKSWIKTLNQLNEDFDRQLGLLGANE
jgi:hypothetical protein